MDRGLGAGSPRAESGGDSADEDPFVRSWSAVGRRSEIPLQGGVHAGPCRQGAVFSRPADDLYHSHVGFRGHSLWQCDTARCLARFLGRQAADPLDRGPRARRGHGLCVCHRQHRGVRRGLGRLGQQQQIQLPGRLAECAQLISYELPLGLGILGVVLVAGSLRLDTIIAEQARCGTWNILTQPLGFLVFCVAAFAEAARLPFDLPEAEQELVGGYHTEYLGIKLMMYLVAEFLHMVTAAFLLVILFLGGWHLWGVTGAGDAVDLARGRAARDRIVRQSDGDDPVFHAGAMELAAIPL